MWNWKGNELKVSAVGFRYLRQLVKLKALQFKIIFQSQPTNAFWNVILWSCKEISYFSRQPTSWHFERAINESILKTFEKCIVKEQVFFHLHWFSFSFFYNTRPTLYVFAKGHKNAVPLANSMYILRHRYDWNKEWVEHRDVGGGGSGVPRGPNGFASHPFSYCLL